MAGEIDIEDFHLGEGPLGQKKDRVLRFVNRLVNDEVLQNKFKKKDDNIKQTRRVQANAVKRAPITNPDLEYLESMYQV